MSSNTRLGADFSVSDLAATFAHSLNNLLGLVHAGHSHLESESHDGALRARAALQRVCSEGNVVSASLSVLALDLAKVEAIRTGGRFDWDAHEWGLLEDALSDIAGVTYAGPFPAPALRATISAPLHSDLRHRAASKGNRRPEGYPRQLGHHAGAFAQIIRGLLQDAARAAGEGSPRRGGTAFDFPGTQIAALPPRAQALRHSGGIARGPDRAPARPFNQSGCPRPSRGSIGGIEVASLNLQDPH